MIVCGWRLKLNALIGAGATVCGTALVALWVEKSKETSDKRRERKEKERQKAEREMEDERIQMNLYLEQYAIQIQNPKELEEEE